MSKPLVSIIILTYKNGLEDIRKCIASLNNITYKSIEIILVDNGSTDNTVAYVKKHFHKVKLIENKKNLGFCTGNNQGAKIARGKYVLLFNNDAVATPPFLERLVEELEKDERLGAVQPKIIQLTNKKKLDACASFLTDTGFLYHYGYSQNAYDKKYNKEIYMYSAKGACFLTRKKLIEKIGLFDDQYFVYFEDTDFCHRIWLAGSRIKYIPSSEVFHLGGEGKKVSSFIQFHSYKNRIATYIKNLETRSLLRILPAHTSFCLGIILVYVLRGEWSYSFAILKAFAWNLINLNKTIRQRKRIQEKIRKVSDNSISDYITKNVGISYYKHFLSNPRGFYNFKEV